LYSQGESNTWSVPNPMIMAKHKPKQFFDETGKLIIRPYRMIDLTQIFDVNYKTFKRWVSNIEKELGKPNGKYYSIRQVEYMIAQFGLPRIVTEETMRKAA
jgi:hypothetical protein